MRRHPLLIVRILLGVALLSCAGTDSITRPESKSTDVTKGVPAGGLLSTRSPSFGAMSTRSPTAVQLSSRHPEARPLGSSSLSASVSGPAMRMLWQNTITGDRSLWVMNGTSWDGSYVLLPQVPTSWSIAGSADFDADGDADIVWQNT